MLWNEAINYVDILGLVPHTKAEADTLNDCCLASKESIYNKIKEGGELSVRKAKDYREELHARLNAEKKEKFPHSSYDAKRPPLWEWGRKVCCKKYTDTLKLSDLVTSKSPSQIYLGQAKCGEGWVEVGLFHNHPNKSDLSGGDESVAKDGTASGAKDLDGDGKKENFYEPDDGKSTLPNIPIGRTIDGTINDTNIYDPTGGGTFSWPQRQ